MKKIILAICFVLLSSSISIAQNEIDNTKYFELTIERTSQSPLNKNITYVVTVVPQIDSSRTQIIWDTPTALTVSPRHKEFVSLKRGETYQFKSIVKPQRSGTYEVNVNLVAWQYDTNYSNSTSDILTLDPDLIAQPVSQGYGITQIALILTLVLLAGAGIFFLIKKSKVWITKLKEWLTPPN